VTAADPERDAGELPFADRTAAGRALARALADRRLHAPDSVVVLGLPRGGVPVAAEVARALRAPLDVFVVRKLGTPGHPELAMGAIASGGVRVLNTELLRRLGVSDDEVDQVAADELVELQRRERAYRASRPAPELTGRTVVLVDDGLATGATMRAAVTAVRAAAPQRVVVAVPVGAPESCAELAAHADDVVCLHSPPSFGAVGAYYLDFTQTSDDEVRRLLAAAAG
jgi:putative phosphoribosyl transferase